jgi:hypothetical protein
MCVSDAEDGALRVVLLCAGDQGEILEDLQSELHAHDSDFDLVAGVDLDSSKAEVAMRRHLDDALYVICREGELDDYSAKHLQRTLRATNLVPESHVIVLKLRAGRANMQAGSLVKRARRTHRPPSSAAPGDSHSGAVLSSNSGTRRRVRPGVSAAQLALAEVDAMKEEVGEAKAERKAREASEEDAPKADATASKRPASEPLLPDLGQEDASDVQASARPDPSSPPPGEREKLSEHKLAPSPAPREASSPWLSRTLAFVGLGALAALAGAWLLAPGEFDRFSDQFRTRLGITAPVSEAESRGPDTVAGGALAAATPDESEEARPATGEPAQATSGPPETEGPGEDVMLEGEDGAGEVTAPERDADEEPDAPAPNPAELELITSALASGTVKQVGAVIVDPVRSSRGDLATARGYCEGRSVGGIEDWRMPEIGELTSILAKKVVGNNMYWSRTPGDAVAKHTLGYNGYNMRIRNLEPGFKGAHTVCVRDHEAAALESGASVGETGAE